MLLREPDPSAGDGELSYLILTTPRTGSYLLCDLLRQTGVAGQPQEFFAPEHQARMSGGVEVCAADYVAAVRDISAAQSGGVFGAKIMWRQLSEYLLPALDRVGVSDWAALSETFANLHIVRLSRRDQARQAVSYARAVQSGLWVCVDAKVKDAQAVDVAMVAQMEAVIAQDEAAITEFLAKASVPHCHVFYEDLARKTDETVRGILDFLGLADTCGDTPIFPRLSRQADVQTEHLLEQFSIYKRRPAQ